MSQHGFFHFFKVYWRGAFSVAYPLALLPIFMMSDEAPMRCLYVLLIVSGYWIFDVLPLPITAMIPLFLFPLLNLMDSTDVAHCYSKNAMIVIGGIMMAIALEHSNLHSRICLHVMNKIGFKPRKLLVAMVILTAFFSMWTSVTAATAMMIKIVHAALKEMEAGGICDMWIHVPKNLDTVSLTDSDIADISNRPSLTSEERLILKEQKSDELLARETLNNDDQVPTFDDTLVIENFTSSHQPERRSKFLSNLGSIATFEKPANTQNKDTRVPTKITMCYFISTSLAANIGGLPTLVGSGPNKVLKGIFYATFPSTKGISLVKWIGTNLPLMLVMLILTMLWMQVFYLGLFRPHSADALAISTDITNEEKTRDMIRQKIDELPPMSFHEIMVAIVSISVASLWFFRDPGFMTGWMVINEEMKDVTVAIGAMVLMFMIPARPHCFRYCSKTAKPPKVISRGLLTWEVVHRKFPWGLIFLLGGGVALAVGLKKSGTSALIAETLVKGLGDSQYLNMVSLCLVSTVMTQIMSNVVVASVFLPIVAELAIVQKVNPVYFMLPVTITCNFAFCLPVSTPATAMASFACHIRTINLLKMTIPVTLICLLVLFALFPLLEPLIWEMM